MVVRLDNNNYDEISISVLDIFVVFLLIYEARVVLFFVLQFVERFAR